MLSSGIDETKKRKHEKLYWGWWVRHYLLIIISGVEMVLL